MAKKALAEKPISSRASIKQRRLAKKLVEAVASDISITGGQLVANAGYGVDMQRRPGEIINSKGVQDELAVMGFSESKAKEVVAVILGDYAEKSDTRLKAAEMVFKAFGTYAPERSINLNVDFKPDARSVALTQEFEEKLKGSLKE